MEFDDPELEPTILPLDARLSVRGSSALLRAIFDRMATVAPQKEKIPNTSYVYVVASDGFTRFVATDGAQTLVIKTDKLRVLREGKALLPAHKIRSILGMAPDETAVLTILANTATVGSGRAIWNITIPSGEKAPAIPDISDITLHTVSSKSLFRALTAAKRAIPTLGGRKSLEQAHIAAGSVTASDGYRLIRQRIEGFPVELSFSVPKDTVEELVRTLAGADEEIQIGADDTMIVVRQGPTILVSRRLSLDYPDLESQLLTPALENKNSLTIDTIELRELIKRVRISADPEYASVSFHMSKSKTGEWELNVLTRDRAGNSASESMFAIWEGEAPGEITLNHKYLIDLIDAYSGRLAVLRVGANTKTRAAPLLLRDDDSGYVGVIQQSIGR